MAVYEMCPPAVSTMAADIMAVVPTHKPLVDAGVKIDFIFARAAKEGEMPIRLAGGTQAYGTCRINSLKNRVLGRGDAEIMLDGDWWDDAPADVQRAVLDHEITHLAVKLKNNRAELDDIGRPRLGMRPHDVQFGWFTQVAQRHGMNSIECRQARTIMDKWGQSYWPALCELNSKPATTSDKPGVYLLKTPTGIAATAAGAR